MERSRLLFQTVLGTVFDGIFFLDSTNRIMLINEEVRGFGIIPRGLSSEEDFQMLFKEGMFDPSIGMVMLMRCTATFFGQRYRVNRN
ncbi:MAG: hypothetical protein IPG53_11950 [Ignavibacteriales bacterium]|nr:hypothetical protein [Ignavibacteriales bacterium]